MTSITATELAETDLPFLLDLWKDPEVMRYADELPRLRGWTKSYSPATAWGAYQEMRSQLGEPYVQLILRLQDGTPIGEAFTAALQNGATFGRWKKPAGTLTLFGDIKVKREHWGRGLGTTGMRLVVRHRFSTTSCDLFCVPPHRKNTAAYKVHERSGFQLFTGMRSYRNHRLMELTRARFEELYQHNL